MDTATAVKRNQTATQNIAAQVRGFYSRKQPFRIYHGSTNSTRESPYTRDNIIDISDLHGILKVDEHTLTALVEPNVPMDDLVQSTLAHGLIPPVVMEFPGITVGGGFAGMAGESSSFKYGTFDCIVKSIVVVLGNGEIVKASTEENVDLFYGAAGSCGTLGVITLLEVSLIRAQPYIELLYEPVSSVHDAVQGVKTALEDDSVEFLDSIIFQKTSGLIMKGRFVDKPRSNTKTQRFTRSRDQWFYRNAEKKLAKSRGVPWTEIIPLVDYLFRYDRGSFWGGRVAFKYFKAPFNRVTRWIIDPYLHTRVMYHALHASGIADQMIIQDVSFPYSTVEDFIQFETDVLGIVPLWLCPIRMHRSISDPSRRTFALGKHLLPTEMLLNVGVWGMGPRKSQKFFNTNREFERKVHELRGIKCLYARTYYTEDEFWSVYNKAGYDELRSKYSAETLPSVYDKVKVDLQKQESRDKRNLNFLRCVWPFAGFYGIWRATVGGDYLLHKKEKTKHEH